MRLIITKSRLSIYEQRMSFHVSKFSVSFNNVCHFLCTYIIILLLSLLLSILFLFLSIVKYIQCKIYHLNHFKVCNTVVLNAFTLLWNQPPKKFSSCRYLSPLNGSSFFPPPRPSQSPPYFLHMNLTAVGTGYKWSHIAFVHVTGIFHLA